MAVYTFEIPVTYLVSVSANTSAEAYEALADTSLGEHVAACEDALMMSGCPLDDASITDVDMEEYDDLPF